MVISDHSRDHSIWMFVEGFVNQVKVLLKYVLLSSQICLGYVLAAAQVYVCAYVRRYALLDVESWQHHK